MFDPNQIADPETLALELLIEDQANEPDDPYLEWFSSCDELDYRDNKAHDRSCATRATACSQLRSDRRV